ncbi:response regulator transcription factor [Pseudomonas sp. KNUC1026]|uniref:response regulator transcription factor n=1 Tax=Pseudomonas sp. KNUC1026 TaxID=2893890 RepID=UPI001F3611D6|nr:response regulator transcription factor [Pseudomonas sp. KNUC1026]UFH48845.1 response regulator transcription factor [Pseudomonas sp. KNUC1026]
MRYCRHCEPFSYSPEHPTPRLLLVEDDPTLCAALGEHLYRRRFSLRQCRDGLQALALATSERFDLILLDILLPGLDGLGLLRQLRSNCNVPVMLMSALGAEQDRITGFTQGADDYLPKPFSLAELDARIDALLRRAALHPAPAPAPSLGLAFDEHNHDVSHQGRCASLTRSEYRLLCVLRDHMGSPLSKPFLYQQVLHRAYTRLDRGLDVHICNLRRKLGQIGRADLQLLAIRNQGYQLTLKAC